MERERYVLIQVGHSQVRELLICGSIVVPRMQMNEVMKALRSHGYIENVIVHLSPLQTGTAARAVHGGGSLQAMSFMSRKSDRLSGEHSSRGETSLFSASALDMRRHFPKLGPFPSIHAVVEPGEVV